MASGVRGARARPPRRPGWAHLGRRARAEEDPARTGGPNGFEDFYTRAAHRPVSILKTREHGLL